MYQVREDISASQVIITISKLSKQNKNHRQKRRMGKN